MQTGVRRSFRLATTPIHSMKRQIKSHSTATLSFDVPNDNHTRKSDQKNNTFDVPNVNSISKSFVQNTPNVLEIPRNLATKALNKQVLACFNDGDLKKLLQVVKSAIENGDTIDVFVWTQYFLASNAQGLYQNTIDTFQDLYNQNGNALWKQDHSKIVLSALVAANQLRQGDLALRIVQSCQKNDVVYLRSRNYFDAIWANSNMDMTESPVRFNESGLEKALLLAQIMVDDGYCLPPFVWISLLRCCFHFERDDKTVLDITRMMTQHPSLMVPDVATLRKALLLPFISKRPALGVETLELWAPHLSHYSVDEVTPVFDAVIKSLPKNECSIHIKQVKQIMSKTLDPTTAISQKSIEETSTLVSGNHDLKKQVLMKSNGQEYRELVDLVDEAKTTGQYVHQAVWARYIHALNELGQFKEAVECFHDVLEVYGDSMWRYDRLDLIHHTLQVAKSCRDGALAFKIIQETQRHCSVALKAKHYFDGLWANSTEVEQKNSKSTRFSSENLSNAIEIARMMVSEGYVLLPFVWLSLLDSAVKHGLPDDIILELTKMMAENSPNVINDYSKLMNALQIPIRHERFDASAGMLQLFLPNLNMYTPYEAARICETILKPMCHHSKMEHVSHIMDLMVDKKLQLNSYVLYNHYIPTIVQHLSAPLFLAHFTNCEPTTLSLDASIIDLAIKEYSKRGKIADVECLLSTARERDFPVTWSSIELILAMYGTQNVHEKITELVTDIVSELTPEELYQIPNGILRHAIESYMELQEYEQVENFYKKFIGWRKDDFSLSMKVVVNAARFCRDRNRDKTCPT